ncbi:MAG: hypothetical protein FWH29_07125 [Methanobrevibacter sp.]|nr:hypothetical protein [Methanobrevibacter sp.]
MSTPIAPTPIIYGEDADEFVEKMFKPFSKEKKAHFKKVLEMFDDEDIAI